MPILDSYLLDNYILDGSLGTEKFTTIAPAEYLVNNIVVPKGSPLGTVLGRISKFPAGTKLISLSPTSNTGRMLYVGTSPSTTVVVSYALMDRKGIIWPIFPPASSYNEVQNCLYAIVAIPLGVAAGQSTTELIPSPSSQVSWTYNTFSKPATFDVHGPIELVVALVANSSSSGSVSYRVSNVRITSA